MKRVIVLIGALLLAGCDNTDWHDAGYKDGYATGFNTACGCVGYHTIHGKWDNPDYSSSYSTGMVDGISDCKAKAHTC